MSEFLPGCHWSLSQDRMQAEPSDKTGFSGRRFDSVTGKRASSSCPSESKSPAGIRLRMVETARIFRNESRAQLLRRPLTHRSLKPSIAMGTRRAQWTLSSAPRGLDTFIIACARSQGDSPFSYPGKTYASLSRHSGDLKRPVKTGAESRKYWTPAFAGVTMRSDGFWFVKEH
jgi:hypothetical protein